MTSCLSLIWQRRKIRWSFTNTAIGSVLCYDTVPAEFLTKIINFKDGAERFEKAQSKERAASPTKKSRRDRNTSRETLGHKSQDQETLETRPLGEILGTAEFFYGKQRQRNLHTMHLGNQKSEVLKSSELSCSFVSSNKENEEIDMEHLQNSYTGQW